MVLIMCLFITGCKQAKEPVWTDEDQAQWNADIGLNNGPIYYGDQNYFEYSQSKSENTVTRKELLQDGYGGYCKNNYEPRPTPPIINYDTGETEPVKENPPKLVAYECQVIRKPSENPTTYTPLQWWMDTQYQGITREKFNELTGRGFIIHDYSKPSPY